MKLIITAFFLSLVLVANGQKYELGNVTIDELSQKKHPREAAAEAAVLFSRGNTYFEYTQKEGFIIVTDVEKKIKIYTKAGYKFADYSTSLFSFGAARGTVDFSKAVTYNLVNGFIEKTKLKSENQFDEKVDKNWSKFKISMPNVKEGCIIEYKYSVRRSYFINLPTWSFQQTIPVDYSEYQIAKPEFFFYNNHLKGYLIPKVKTVKKNKIINYDTKNLYNIMNNLRFDQLGVRTIEFEELITNYTIKNIPALKNEDFVNNIDNYASSIEHELSGIQFPNEAFKSFATTWESMAAKIFEKDNFGNELKKTNYFENEITALTKDLKTDIDKINTVFSYVKNRMKWNENKSYLCEVGVEKAFKAKMGNSAEINLMLTAMLPIFALKAFSTPTSQR